MFISNFLDIFVTGCHLDMDLVELEPHIFKVPSVVNLVGSSGSGKTSLVVQILQRKSQLFQLDIKGVYYAYAQWQDIFSTHEVFKDVKFIEGLPTAEQLEDIAAEHAGAGHVLIIDDMMDKNVKSELVSDLATCHSHHRKTCLIIQTQNLYPRGPYARNIALNTTHFIFTRNLRDVQQLKYFSSQVFNDKGVQQKFMDIYYDSVDNFMGKIPITYLLVICHPLQHRAIRLLTNCFQDQPPVVYKLS